MSELEPYQEIAPNVFRSVFLWKMPILGVMPLPVPVATFLVSDILGEMISSKIREDDEWTLIDAGVLIFSQKIVGEIVKFLEEYSKVETQDLISSNRKKTRTSHSIES